MSGQIRQPRDASGIAHADDSILLAYIRRQSLGESEPDIHQHIAHCEQCCDRCNELQQTSTILDDTLLDSQRNSLPLLHEDIAWDWLQSSTAAQLAYQRRQHERLHEDLALGLALLTRLPLALLALLAQAVPALLPYMRKLKLESQRHGHHRMAMLPLTGAFAATFLVLALTAIVVLAALNGHNPFRPSHTQGDITTTVAPSTLVVSAQPTPTPAVVSRAGVTLTPNGSMPTIFECMPNNNKTPHRFGICGKNFKPGTRVELVIQFGDGSSKTRHSVGIDQSGQFQIVWSISSCKDVPTSITAQNVTHPSVYLDVLSNIPFGKCSSNPRQTAGTNHH